MSAPQTSTKSNYATGCIIALLSGCLVTLLLLLIVMDTFRRMHVDSARGRPISVKADRFMVVAFPRRTEQRHLVQRAILLRLEEYNSETYEVLIGGKPVKLNAAEFQVLPDEAQEQSDVAALNREIATWGDTDWKHVEYFINRHGNEDECVVRLTITLQKKGRIEYLYRVSSNGKATPVWAMFYGPF